ncbi:MAG: phage portal protein [Caulobacter sp.]|nr:phage portal protein [Caulobacter sp.]
MTTPQLLGPNGAVLPAGIGAAIRAMASTDFSAAAATRGGSARDQHLAGWNPPNLSADSSWLWSKDQAVARVHDLLEREPWAQGGVDRKMDMIIGASWRPSINPDHEALGITLEQAADLGRAYERAFRGWSEDPLWRGDLEEAQNFSFQLHMVTMEQQVGGDGLGVLRWKPDRGWAYGTALQIIDATRLSTPMGRPESDTLRGGVELNNDGAASAYHFRNRHPGDLFLGTSVGAYTWERVERREPWGRPKVLHLYAKDRPGQTRGVSRLVAALSRFKGLSRYSEAELGNAVMNALFAATITSSFDPAVAEQHLTANATAGYHELRETVYDANPPMMGGVRIQHLFPGDDLKFLTTGREAGGFAQFTMTFLRSIAAGLGIMYEQLTGDWSQVNYSAARFAFIDIWRGIQKDRARVAMMFATPVLLAVLEDAIDAGLVDLPAGCPGLYEAPAAHLRVKWIGPARGWVDPVKEPAGALLQMALGATTGEDIAADQGNELDRNIPILAAEAKRWKEAGLMPPSMADMIAAVQAVDTQPEPARQPAA